MAANLSTLCWSTEDVVVEILSRLPPKSLMPFQCVRKSWYNLINSPSFVAKNLSYSKKNEFASSSCFLFKRTVLEDNTIKDKNEIYLILIDGNNDNKETVLSILTLCNHDIDDQNQKTLVKLSGRTLFFLVCIPLIDQLPVIVCISSAANVILCNPAIKEFQFLPKSRLLLHPKCRNDYDNDDDYYDVLESDPSGVGFGYDSKDNVYKTDSEVLTGFVTHYIIQIQ